MFSAFSMGSVHLYHQRSYFKRGWKVIEEMTLLELKKMYYFVVIVIHAVVRGKNNWWRGEICG